MTRAEFTRRLRAFERSQHVALAIGALPLLAVYFAVHTRWLKPLIQDHKHLMVAMMILLPLGWMFAVAQGWKRLGPRWLGLRCVACGESLAVLPPPVDDDACPCPACGARAIEAGRANR